MNKKPKWEQERPSHYDSEFEPIKIIEYYSLHFHLGNVIKYVLREQDKGGVDDLKKAANYLQREIERRK